MIIARHSKGMRQDATSMHPDHAEPLTPNHLLIGRASVKPIKEEASLEVETTGWRLAYLATLEQNW